MTKREHTHDPLRLLDDQGRLYSCSNDRMRHPIRRYTDHYGVSRPEVLPNCSYHSQYCVKAHDGTAVKIVTPNKFSLCNKCFVEKVGSKPPEYIASRTPGIT